MRNLTRRVENLENKFAIGKKNTTCTIIVIKEYVGEDKYVKLLESVEDWITYKEEMAKPSNMARVFIADPRKEIETRKRLQKEAKGNEIKK